MNAKLSNKIKILYGAGDMGIALLTASTQFFLLFFYTDIARYDAAVVGTALLVGKLTWDAFNDPILGYLSDRTRTRFGRRRPYLLFGALPLAFATWVLYSVPGGLVGTAAFLTVLFSFLLFDTFHTLVGVSYFALTPELTPDYEERTSLTAVRMTFSVLGYIIGAAATTAIATFFMQQFGWSEKAGYSGMGAVFGLIAAAAVLTTAFGVREKPVQASQSSPLPPLNAVLQTLRNRPFVVLIGAFFISSFSFTLLTSLLPFFLTYQLQMEAQIPLVMLVMLATIGIFLLLWKKIADRINKGPAYALGLFIASLAVIATFFFPHQPTPLVYGAAFLAGFGFSAQWVFPWSMLPDVIEYDQLVTGERREGVYYGMWAFLSKFTNALGIAVSSWALSLFGYVAGAVQTESALFGIRLFFAIVPSVALLLSLPLLIWYPVTKASHAKVRAELEKAGL